ncbi:MAG: N-acetylglucosaminyl-phosphatidylinositol de-N-acetylase [Candelina submexicana]|nr:MAG: N-acetylglucosaminyl-phosphatidylinositol de-N-acetylase [Candelina submexicana]
MQSITLLAFPLLFTACWLYTVHIQQTRFPRLQNKKICLLIAHPDDEAMFFAPTVLALTRPKLGNHVKILCLSSGDADGLGETRKKELVKSGILLGLRREEDVFVIEDPAFPDSMTTPWDASKISTLLTSIFAPNILKSSSQTAPTASIDILITFDRHGISSHPNHTSLRLGALEFLKSIMQRHSGWQSPVTLYTLTSTNVLRKYMSILDAPLTMLHCVSRKTRAREGRDPSQLFFVSCIEAYRTAQKAMTSAHKSQMRWFRWGWIGASRYMIVNDLKPEKVV